MPNNKNFLSQPRKNPQKCGLCNSPGHNRKCRDCPINLLNAENQKLFGFHPEELNRLTEIDKQLVITSSSPPGESTSQRDHPTNSTTRNATPPPNDEHLLNRTTAAYYHDLAHREAELYKVSRPSSSSMEIPTVREHRQITLSKPFYDMAGFMAGAPSSPMDVVDQPEANLATETTVNYDLPQTSVTAKHATPDPFFAGGPYLPADEVDDMQHQHYMAIERNKCETLVAFAPPQISVTPYLHADEVDDERHQHYMAIERLQQFQGRGPPPYTSSVAVRPLPRRPEQFDSHPAAENQYSQVMAGTPDTPIGVLCSVGGRKKRARNLVEFPVSEAREVLGAEESKGESTPVEASISSPPLLLFRWRKP